MSFAVALEALSKIEGGADLVEAVKEEVNRKGSENASLRQRLKAFDGIDIAKVKTLAEKLEIDLSGDVDSQIGEFVKVREAAQKSVPEVERLRKEIERINKTLADKDALAANLEKQAKEGKIRSAFSSVPDVSKKIANFNDTLELRIMKGDFSIDESGEVGYKRGDTFIPVSKGAIDEFLKDNPGAALNYQQSGSGGSGGSGSPAKKTMPISEVNSLPPAARVEFFKSGGEAI